MKTLKEALIGRHNVTNSIPGSRTRCVYVSDPNPNEKVWILVPLDDFIRRYHANQVTNGTIEKVIKTKDIIGVWVLPRTGSPASTAFYIRAATGDVEKDFETLVKSRDVPPTVKEFVPRYSLDKNMTIVDYYKKEDHFSKELNELGLK